MILEQFERANNSDALLIGPLHFCGLDCLRKWIDAAAEEYPRLLKMAQGLHPRGMFTGKVKGLGV